MFPIDYINAIPPELTMTIQLGAARAIYGAIVFAAIALALGITYDSISRRGDGRPQPRDLTQDRQLDRAA